MKTIAANGYRVFGGTTAQWAEHDDLLHYREMGIEFTSDGRVLMKFGVWTEGDVGTPWSRLPYSSGPAGPSPEFEWQGTSARFKNPDGSWGDWVNLQGPRGPQGEKGAEGPIATSVIPATRTTLGGVLVGSTLEVTPEGCLDVKQGVVPRPAASAPRAPGAAEVGTSTQYAREDHRHPLQTTITGNAATATNAQNATTAETCTGNAATASSLATARTITANDNATAGASFDGSKNVSLGIPVTIAAGTAANTLPGTGTLSLRAWLTAARNCLAWLGARFNANGAALTAVTATNATNATTAGTCAGNAATATKLATARKIATNLASTTAVAFDGSVAITTGVTGVLSVANGGTGNTSGTATGITGLTVPAAGAAPGANALIRTNNSGYAYTGHINQDIAAADFVVNNIVASNDNFLRKITPSNFRKRISVPFVTKTSNATLGTALSVEPRIVIASSAANALTISKTNTDAIVLYPES